MKVGGKRRILSLGRADFTIAAGRTTAVRLRLTGEGRRLLRRTGSLRVRIVVSARDAAGNVGRSSRLVRLER